MSYLFAGLTTVVSVVGFRRSFIEGSISSLMTSWFVWWLMPFTNCFLLSRVSKHLILHIFSMFDRTGFYFSSKLCWLDNTDVSCRSYPVKDLSTDVSHFHFSSRREQSLFVA